MTDKQSGGQLFTFKPPRKTLPGGEWCSPLTPEARTRSVTRSSLSMRVSGKAGNNPKSPSTAQEQRQALPSANFHLDSHPEKPAGYHHICLQTDQRKRSDLSKKGDESLVAPDSMKAKLAAVRSTTDETPQGSSGRRKECSHKHRRCSSTSPSTNNGIKIVLTSISLSLCIQKHTWPKSVWKMRS